MDASQAEKRLFMGATGEGQVQVQVQVQVGDSALHHSRPPLGAAPLSRVPHTQSLTRTLSD